MCMMYLYTNKLVKKPEGKQRNEQPSMPKTHFLNPKQTTNDPKGPENVTTL